MRKPIISVATAAVLFGGISWWRQNRRAGAGFVNRIINPWLVRNGFVGVSRGELGLIEHVGRRSGIVRRTPIHPMPTADGFRIIVPIGERSEWAQNVQAAGHCRLFIGDRVFELDEPKFERPADVANLPRLVRTLFEWLGFRYLLLQTLFDAEIDTTDGPVHAAHVEREVAFA